MHSYAQDKRTNPIDLRAGGHGNMRGCLPFALPLFVWFKVALAVSYSVKN